MSPKLTPYEQMDAYAKAIYDQWVFEAVMTCAIQMPWPHDVEIICGYNPQRLLAPPDKRRTFHERLEAWRVGDDLAAHGLDTSTRGQMYGTEMQIHDGLDDDISLMRPRESTFGHRAETLFAGIDLDNEYIDFDNIAAGLPSAPMQKYIVVTGARMHFDPIDHNRRYRAINDMEAVVPRWGESDADPLADIEEMTRRFREIGLPSDAGKTDARRSTAEFFCHLDMSEVELAYLFAALRHESRPVILNLDPAGGDLPGAFTRLGQSAGQLADAIHLFTKAAATCERLPSRPDYHRHDPTKRHGTRGSMRRQRKSK